MERKINWYSGCHDEIELVYDKAAENEHIAATLMELETMALQEAEESCGMLKMGDKPITREMFIEMSEQDKETVMYYLSGAGLQEFVPSMTEGKITVTFTPHIQSVLGCTMFSVLNRLEKLDGAFNVMFPEATLELRVPLGAKKGMMKCEMLIMQLYPWLSITETATNTVSSTINIQPELEAKAPTAETVKSSQGKEEKPLLDCAQNQHEFEIAEQCCDSTKDVCKKCGENSESQKHIETLEKALELFADSGQQDTNFLKQIIILLTRAPLVFPIEMDTDAMFSGVDPTTLKAGDTFSPNQDVKIIIRTLMVPVDEQPEEIIPAFTSLEEANKGPQSSFIQMYPQEYLQTVSQMGKPVVINLFSKTLLHLRPKVFQEILPDLMNDSLGGKSEIETSRQCAKNSDNDSNDTMDKSLHKAWKESNLYKHKQFSILGDSISTLAGYNPRGYDVFYDGETCEKSSVKEMKDTWWGKVIDFFGGDLLVNNSWSGSRVTQLPNQERLFPSGCSEERTNNLHIGTLKPDVIIVYLGTNDWANNVPLINLECVRLPAETCTFEDAYNYMLWNLRNNYPNAEIWCCTLCETFMSKCPDFRFPHKYAGTHIEAYNDIIRKSVSRNMCKLLDLYNYKMPYDSIDGTHPNFDGMNTLATMMIREIGGKEVEPFLDCAHNQHEFEIAEQYCDAAKYVCKKCGKSKIETSRQCGNVDKDGIDEKRYCAQCGNVIHKNARFCTNCGKTVSYKSETASPKPIGVGTIIDGKYELLKLIGQGGTFKVFLAMDVRLNKIWAVKILRDDYHDVDYDKQGVLRETALHEASLLKSLNHPAIPSVVDIIDVPGCFATVQDYVEGETLNNLVKNLGAQPVDLVMDWAKQLCAVLSYLHALNPPHIHRDIKPNNLILEPNGRIKIIDFSIMRTYKPNQKNDTCSLGTKGYAAPEQYGGRGQTDARTDIYGVGMTLYHLLTGIDPRGENFVVRPLCQVNPALPKGIEYIIDKCIQLNPKDRYQNCAELLNDLTHYMELPR